MMSNFRVHYSAKAQQELDDIKQAANPGHDVDDARSELERRLADDPEKGFQYVPGNPLFRLAESPLLYIYEVSKSTGVVDVVEVRHVITPPS